MTTIEQSIQSAQESISQRRPYDALSALTPLLASNNDNAELLQTLATAHLEVSALPEEADGETHAEKAYEYFVKAANLDDSNGKGDHAKYLWLGQLSGGRDAVEWFRKGCNGLRKDLSSEDVEDEKKVELRKKLCDALCASVEIWMTDLCMEPEAESTCDALITESLMIDANHPESYSTLASIRLSQQRPDDARIAVQRSWELFNASAEAQRLNQSLSEYGSDEVAQITALKNLTRLSIETELHDLAEEACKLILALDEDIAEVWYLAGLTAAQKYGKSGDPAVLTAAYESFLNALELTENGGGDEPEELADELKQRLAETEAEMANRGLPTVDAAASAGKGRRHGAGAGREGDEEDEDEDED
ncbi:hypothetical protein BZA70DRAFT_276558, partial [Myxozyma melibiosi]